MTDEIALAKALGRAAQAQRLLDDELLQEAFANYLGDRPPTDDLLPNW